MCYKMGSKGNRSLVPALHIEEEGSGSICKQHLCAITAETVMYFAIFLCRNANRTYEITK